MGLINVHDRIPLTVNAVIEREAGEDRIADVRRARDFLSAALAAVKA